MLPSSPSAPPAPWSLEGSGAISPWLVDARLARDLVPPELSVVEVLPGLTLGSVFGMSYLDSPVGGYDELGFAPALVQAEGAWGFYVSQLFVDSRAAEAGGKANWGLPKELADISWDHQDHRLRVEVKQAGVAVAVCQLESRQWGPTLPARLRLPLLTLRDGRVHCASLTLSARLASASARVRIGAGSPLEGLGLRIGLPGVWAWEAQLELGPARPVAGA